MSRRGAGDQGTVFVMTAVLLVALVGLAGLAYDGAMWFDARRRAINVADEAARAGAAQVTEESVRAGAPRLDRSRAVARAESFAGSEGADDAAAVAVGTVVEVTAEFSWSPTLLGVVGVGTKRFESTCEARVVWGTTEAST